MAEPADYWNRVYQTRQSEELSWYQPQPSTSLRWIQQLAVPRQAKIIDVGGGDSPLVDFLLEQDYEHITVLDVSEVALERARQRLGSEARRVNWLVADITRFRADESYDFWHDRAVFHFLTTPEDVSRYAANAHQALRPAGRMVVGTFAEDGPTSCSGLPVRRYSEPHLADAFVTGFRKIRCAAEHHQTPKGTTQAFRFCSFLRL